MTTLSEAPLIESIIEIRWGEHKLEPNKPVEFKFLAEDTDFFPGQFHGIANSKGFVFVEQINKDVPPIIPHLVRYRFRRSEGQWPCYQIGLGIFTVNQVNEGYDWETFKKDILAGLQMLDKGHPVGLRRLPVIGIEMRYRDGFLFGGGETSTQFLKNKLKINFQPPEEVLESPNLAKKVENYNLSFKIALEKPKGLLIISLAEELINGQLGFIMDTIVRSADDLKPMFEMGSLEIWLEEAHNIQKHAFRTLINPAYANSFK